jgi:hypothetical protein
MQGDLETGGPMFRLEIGFLLPFFVLPKGRGVSQVSWEGEVSPWPIITFWDLLQSILQFPFSMIAVTAVRVRKKSIQ